MTQPENSPAAMRLSVFELAVGAAPLEPEREVTRFAYVRTGNAAMGEGSETTGLGPGEGGHVKGSITARPGSAVWIFEAGPADSGPGEGTPVLSDVVVPAFGPPYVLRLDRIESQPGVQTPRHGHRGPGLRRLVTGCLRAEVGSRVERIGPGGAWLETGAEPVVGTNIGTGPAVFVRLLLLPHELEGGQSSFVPWSAAEVAKSRAVSPLVFAECKIRDRCADWLCDDRFHAQEHA